jgi:hypothetical protein
MSWYTPEFLGTKPFWGIVAAAVTVSAGVGVAYYNGGAGINLNNATPEFQVIRVHGAPGPLMGAAGLPLLVAYGIYRMVRRRKGS